MADLQFTEDDIRRQLELLGYPNVPRDRLRQFAHDLEKLIEEEKIPLQSDESLYSDVSGHPDTSADSFGERSNNNPGASRSPLYDVNIASRHPQASFPQKYHEKSKRKEAGIDQENHGSSLNPPLRAPEGALRGIEERVYDPYERRRVNPDAARKAPMKRKVVRKKNGQSQVFDESVTESESDISYLNERLQGLPLNDGDDDDEARSETSSAGFNSFRRHIGRPNTSQGLYHHRPGGDEDSVYKPHLPRSFIRPTSAANQTYKHSKKTDPVTRHQMYQSQWKSQKAPGEKNHKGLRWSVREHMMYKDEVVQPKTTPRVYMPNEYVVPTDKKRQALRWAVRTQLAHKEMPSNSFNF